MARPSPSGFSEMTRDRFVEALDMLAGDAEVAHGMAERIILDAVRFLGEPEIAAAFERARDRVGFWYA